MDSGYIGKVEKARRYASQPGRLSLHTIGLTVHGENAEHEVVFADGRWECDCGYFAGHGMCAHSMAAQRRLGDLLPAAAGSAPVLGGSAVGVTVMDAEEDAAPRD
jgi:hypothetical protein